MTKLVFFSKIIKKATDVLERIPIIKTVYSTSKQIIGVVYSGDGESVYKKVVLRLSGPFHRRPHILSSKPHPPAFSAGAAGT